MSRVDTLAVTEPVDKRRSHAAPKTNRQPQMAIEAGAAKPLNKTKSMKGERPRVSFG